MLDKKINETIDQLIKKIKENNLTSIKLSNKTNTIEISNNSSNIISSQRTPPFAKRGQKIKKGDTICLIEAMKTFNEIKSDRDCTIKSIIVKNGEAVEFGQPLFEIS